MCWALNPYGLRKYPTTIPIEAVEEVSARFANTLFGYFIGKRLVFPLVENYVKNTWAKFGLERVMLQNGFFFFQFAIKEGMEKVIENGPWLIRLVLLILNVWTPNSKLKKDEITSVPVWIKLHKVPIVAYSEVGLSLITTKIGHPIMLDSYTSSMCLKSWGRNTYAIALVEVSADKELVDSLVVAIPFPNGKEVAPLQANDDGFIEVTRKRVKSKARPKRQIEGVRLSKPKPNFYYRPKFVYVVGETSSKQDNEKSGDKGTNQVTNHMSTTNVSNYGRASSPKELDNQQMPLKNSFAALMDEADPTQPCNEDNEANNLGSDEDENDSEVMETIVLEEPRFMGGKMKSNESKGASTPSNDVLNSHVASSRLDFLCSHVFRSWKWTSNGSCCSKGSRIILGWNPNDIDISIITQDDQVMHARVWFKADKKELFCSFIYAHNRYTHRRTLWNSLCLHKHYVRNRPWCLLGDFNAALNLADHSAGSSNIDISMREFKDCVEEIKVLDVNRSGLNFTWNQKPKGADKVLKKIDRIMANLEFQDIFIGAHAIFQPYRISDHSPAVLKIPRSTTVIPKPFEFSNILIYNVRFKDMVKDGWDLPVSGFYMFQVVIKLKHMKKSFRKLLYDHGNLHDNVKRLRFERDKVQSDLDLDPSNNILREEEAVYVLAFNEALIMEERFLKQKAKIEWLRVGDSNSAYFHKAVKGRVSRSRIDVVFDSNGVLFKADQVPLAFVNHYAAFLGQQGVTSNLNTHNLFTKKLDSNVAFEMIKTVTNQEVKDAIFSMGNDKSPVPDGYTAAFFK
ncbi:hypothetical protein Tco_1050728 [Tanacetum coccineum]